MYINLAHSSISQASWRLDTSSSALFYHISQRIHLQWAGHYILPLWFLSSFSKVTVNLNIRKVPLNTIHFQSTQIWQHTVLPANMSYLPLLPSCRAWAPFGWYSFYHPIEGRRLSRPGWLITYRKKCHPWESNPDMVTHPSTNRAQHRLTSLSA